MRKAFFSMALLVFSTLASSGNTCSSTITSTMAAAITAARARVQITPMVPPDVRRRWYRM